MIMLYFVGTSMSESFSAHLRKKLPVFRYTLCREWFTVTRGGARQINNGLCRPSSPPPLLPAQATTQASQFRLVDA